MRLSRLSLWVAVAALLGCSRSGTPQPSDTEPGVLTTELALATATADRGATEHLLVEVSYDNGVFAAERVVRASGGLRQPRSGRHRGALRYLARSGANVVQVGGMPDFREVHVEYADPLTGQLHRASAAAPGKQRFLVHVPSSTETVDFYEAAALEPGTSRTAVAPRGRATTSATPASAPLGSVSLKGLIQ